MNRNLIKAAVMIFDAKDETPTKEELRQFFVREGIPLTGENGVTFDGCCQNAQAEPIYHDEKPVGVLRMSDEGKFFIALHNAD